MVQCKQWLGQKLAKRLLQHRSANHQPASLHLRYPRVFYIRFSSMNSTSRKLTEYSKYVHTVLRLTRATFSSLLPKKDSHLFTLSLTGSKAWGGSRWRNRCGVVATPVEVYYLGHVYNWTTPWTHLQIADGCFQYHGQTDVQFAPSLVTSQFSSCSS